ncbi:MAG: agmatinase family protein [Desulfovibrio sp.]|jgi:agmatinase|nr:agmatinase family protein [Desulfovibrio sp.]
MPEKTPRFLESELEPTPACKCRFQIIPVPYEASVSYGRGASRGPAAILAASNQLEVWNGRLIPSAPGIHTWPALDARGNAEEVLARIEAAVLLALDSGPQDIRRDSPGRKPYGPEAPGAKTPVLPVLLGGEHTVTLGALRALKKFYGRLGVIQFDAHADLRASYQGTAYSHACVMRRAVEDLELEIFQIGVRSLSPEEHAFREARGIAYLDAADLGIEDFALEEGKSRPLLPPSFPKAVYLTFDVDALDASLMPATGTPEPGGLFWRQALRLAERSLEGRVCLGFDITELAPLPGMHAPDYTAARLTHELMGLTG